MRFELLRMRQIGPFRGEVVLDLAAIDGLLVAVTGPNGAGKSTALELLPGTLYRSCPTRGTLADLATARDAFVEVVVCNGSRYTVRQTVDAISKKGEVLVLDDAGQPVLDSGKVKQFDEWVKAHLVGPDVLYSSSFAVQGRRGFLDLKPAERKQVLVRVLGIELLEKMADEARARARSVKGEFDVLRARLGDVPATDVDALRDAVTRALSAGEAATVAIQAARQALDAAKAASADAARAREIAAQRAGVEKRLEAAEAVVRDIEERLGNNRGLLSRASEIEAAVERTAELEACAADARAAVTGANADLGVARAEHEAAVSERTRLNATGKDAEARVTRCNARLADRGKVLEAVAAAASFAQLEQDGGESIRDLEVELVALERVLISGKDERIRDLRTGVQAISARPSVAKRVADEVLRQDDTAAAKQEAAPAQLKRAREDLTQRRRSLDGIREQRAAADRLAARAADIEAAEVELLGLEAELTRARADGAAALERMQVAAERYHRLLQQVAEAERAVAPLTEEIAKLASLVKLALGLAQAEARVAELTAQLQPATAAAAQARQDLAALPVVQAGSVDLAGAERGLEQAERLEREHVRLAERAQKALEDGQEAEQRRAQLAAETQAKASNLADWTRLGQDLGRDGLQALELDSALPELNAIANDLLHNCHGSRFTVELKTDRLSADGKKVLEGLDVRVVDTEHGRDDLAETYSGGECVIVGEAVALALTTLACRRNGIERPTIVRDESGSALDPSNGRAYVAMLRRAAGHIGADRVLYVSHTPELQELADARIRITEDGQVITGQ